MTDEITFTLKENQADELYELLKDIDVEITPAFTISDTHGNIAEYVKVIRCKDCARNPKDGHARTICPCPMDRYMGPEGYCSKAEPKETS